MKKFYNSFNWVVDLVVVVVMYILLLSRKLK